MSRDKPRVEMMHPENLSLISSVGEKEEVFTPGTNTNCPTNPPVGVLCLDTRYSKSGFSTPLYLLDELLVVGKRRQQEASCDPGNFRLDSFPWRAEILGRSGHQPGQYANTLSQWMNDIHSIQPRVWNPGRQGFVSLELSPVVVGTDTETQKMPLKAQRALYCTWMILTLYKDSWMYNSYVLWTAVGDIIGQNTEKNGPSVKGYTMSLCIGVVFFFVLFFLRAFWFQ